MKCFLKCFLCEIVISDLLKWRVFNTLLKTKLFKKAVFCLRLGKGVRRPFNKATGVNLPV